MGPKPHPHEKDATWRFFVMHVNLVDAALPCTKVAPDFEEVNCVVWTPVIR